jgi:predicted nucleic acid-binding protein
MSRPDLSTKKSPAKKPPAPKLSDLDFRGLDFPGLDFLDTNILVYAYDVSAPAKQRIAQALLGRAVAGEFTLSTQVLAEFASTLLHKLSPKPAPEQVSAMLDALAPIPAIAPDADMVRRAVQAHAAYGLHFYDAMIVAAAERVGSRTIWSEDMNHGQKYFGVSVANPFR